MLHQALGASRDTHGASSPEQVARFPGDDETASRAAEGLACALAGLADEDQHDAQHTLEPHAQAPAPSRSSREQAVVGELARASEALLGAAVESCPGRLLEDASPAVLRAALAARFEQRAGKVLAGSARDGTKITVATLTISAVLMSAFPCAAASAALATLPPIERLVMDSAAATASRVHLVHLAALDSCTGLHQLCLTGRSRFADGEVAAPRSGLANLGCLYARNGMSDPDLARLTAMSALWLLDLDACRGVPDEGLAHAARLTSIRVLKLSFCRSGPASLADIAKLTEPRVLSLYHVDGVDAERATEHLSKLREPAAPARSSQLPRGPAIAHARLAESPSRWLQRLERLSATRTSFLSRSNHAAGPREQCCPRQDSTLQSLIVL